MINCKEISCSEIENKMPAEKTRFRLGSEQSEVSTSTVMTDLFTDSDETGNIYQPTSASKRPSNEHTSKERETKRAVRKRQVSFSNGADETDVSELQRLQRTNSNEEDSVIQHPNNAQQQYYQQHTSYVRVPFDDENMYSLQGKAIARTRRTRRYTEGSIYNVDRGFERHMLENEKGMRHSKTAPKIVKPDERNCKCKECYAEHREKVLNYYLDNIDREERMPNRSHSITSLPEQHIRHNNNITPFCQRSPHYNTQQDHVDTFVQLDSHFQPYIHPIYKCNKSRSVDALEPIESGDGEVPRMGNAPCRPLPKVATGSDAGTSGYAQMNPSSNNSDPVSSAQSESYQISKTELLKHPLFRIMLILNVLLLVAITAGLSVYMYILNKNPEIPLQTTVDPGRCLPCSEFQNLALGLPLDLGLILDEHNKSVCCVRKGENTLKFVLKAISTMENNRTDNNTPRPVLQLTAENLSSDNTIVWRGKDGGKLVISNTLKLVDGGKAVQINHGGLYFVSTKLSFISKKTSIDGESFAIGHQILVDDETIEEASQMCYFPRTNKTLAIEHVSTNQFVKKFKTHDQVSVQVKSKYNFKPESALIILFYLG